MAGGHTFVRYELTAETLCLGERVRGGLFRPCATVFRYSSLAGALKNHFEVADPIHVTARFSRNGPGTSRREVLSFGPCDRGRKISAVPLEVEYLSNVRAEVFVLKTGETAGWPEKFDLSMGAMRSKGFGRCHFQSMGEVDCNTPVPGELCVRLPDAQDVREAFGIRSVLAPVYGYLFRPTSQTGGVYVRSLFEGTRVVGYEILFSTGGAR